MPVPKRKRSRSRRDKRFANKGIKARMFGSCSNCSEIVVSHSACKSCGYYKGRKVLRTKDERAAVRAESRKNKQAKTAAQVQEPIAAEAEPVSEKK